MARQILESQSGALNCLLDALRVRSTRLEFKWSVPVYQVPLEEEEINVDGCRRFRFGKDSTKPNRTIMVIGATGAGKSTLIDGMINYILGVRWEDKYRIKLVKEVQKETQAVSQTSEVTVYKLNYQDGFQVNYSLTIIDTPGFGDTRGIERDRRITEQIRNLFTSTAGVSDIDAVCFVVQSSLARLTPSQRYVFDSILSIFGKDIAENIRILVTFADGQRPPVLQAIKASGVPCSLKKGVPVHFKFNNSALFVSNSPVKKEDEEEEEEEGGFDQMKKEDEKEEKEEGGFDQMKKEDEKEEKEEGGFDQIKKEDEKEEKEEGGFDQIKKEDEKEEEEEGGFDQMKKEDEKEEKEEEGFDQMKKEDENEEEEEGGFDQMKKEDEKEEKEEEGFDQMKKEDEKEEEEEGGFDQMKKEDEKEEEEEGGFDKMKKEDEKEEEEEEGGFDQMKKEDEEEEEEEEEGGFDQMFWDMGNKSMKSFFVALSKMKTKSLTMTKEVLAERKQLENLVENLQKQVQVGLCKLEEINQTSKMVENNKAKISRNANFKYTVTVTEPHQVDISGTGIYLTNCQQCHYTCHDYCAYANDADKIKCCAMGYDGKCTVCPHKCIWSVHFNQKYKWEYKQVTKTETVKDLKEKYDIAQGEKNVVEALMKKLKTEYKDVQDEVKRLIDKSSVSLNRLKDIALKPDPLSSSDYIDMLIEGEKSQAQPGWKDRVQSLTQMKAKAKCVEKVYRREPLLKNVNKTEPPTEEKNKSFWGNWFKKQ